METQAIIVCMLNRHVGSTETSAFIVFKERSEVDSLTQSAPSPV